MANPARLDYVFPRHEPHNCGAFVEIGARGRKPMILLSYFR